MTKRTRRARPPAIVSAEEAAIVSAEEAAIVQHAREALKAARGAFIDGDPFQSEVMHAQVTATLKELSDLNERNAARAVRLALAGFEDAHEALVGLIVDRNVRSRPLGPALSTYVHILADAGPPPFRQPAVRHPQNFLANLVILCMLIDLKQQFSFLRFRRSQLSKPSLCSIVAAVLDEAGMSRGGEESIRKAALRTARASPILAAAFKKVTGA
jgi:hypothetical protein